jgi:4-hydroxy-tetrahydrodipicolinate reductase
MNNFNGYNVDIKEIHHIHKLDAPSGTAISLANDIIENYKKKDKWELNNETNDSSLKIGSVREGEVPGTHIITWNSEVDRIEIMHESKSRRGLALGAVLAAEFIINKKGVYSMADLIRL